MDFIHKYEITFIQRLPQTKPINFSDLIIPLATIQNMSELRYILEYLPSFNDLTMITDINIFKSPIKPLWEDENNLAGGKYIIKVKRVAGQRLFEKLAINFMILENVNGIVASIRKQQVMLSVWVKEANDDKIEFVRNIREVLDVGYDLIIEFKDNDESLKDNSSFRNTAIFQDNGNVERINKEFDALKVHNSSNVNRRFSNSEAHIRKNEFNLKINYDKQNSKTDNEQGKCILKDDSSNRNETGSGDKKHEKSKIEINKNIKFDERKIISEAPCNKYGKKYGKGNKTHYQSNPKEKVIKQGYIRKESGVVRDDITFNKVLKETRRSSVDDSMTSSGESSEVGKKDEDKK